MTKNQALQIIGSPKYIAMTERVAKRFLPDDYQDVFGEMVIVFIEKISEEYFQSQKVETHESLKAFWLRCLRLQCGKNGYIYRKLTWLDRFKKKKGSEYKYVISNDSKRTVTRLIGKAEMDWARRECEREEMKQVKPITQPAYVQLSLI